MYPGMIVRESGGTCTYLVVGADHDRGNVVLVPLNEKAILYVGADGYDAIAGRTSGLTFASAEIKALAIDQLRQEGAASLGRMLPMPYSGAEFNRWSLDVEIARVRMAPVGTPCAMFCDGSDPEV